MFALLAAQFALWGALLWWAHRKQNMPPGAALWIWALAVRLAGVSYLPWLEDDWYRYLWDGFRTLAGANPYVAAPEAFFGDADMPPMLVPILSGINHPGLPTIYGPGLQYLFAGAALIQPAALWPLKLCLIGLDLALIGLVGRFTSARMQWAYALCPLVILEIGFHAHPDGMGALLAFGAAVCAMRARMVTAAVLMGIACTVKPWALLLAPWILRSRAAAGAFAVTVAGLYAPFLAGSDAGLTTLARFAFGWQFNAPIHGVLDAAVGPVLGRAALACVLVAGWLTLAWRLRARQPAPGEYLFGGALLLSPVVNPWYLLWVLPFATVRPLLTPWAAAAALPLSYAHGLFVDESGLGPYAIAPGASTLEWGVIGLALAWDLWRSRTGHRATR